MSEKQHKARYQQAKGRETITIRRNSRSEQIVIVLPAEPELLKEALQHLPQAAKQRKASSSRHGLVGERVGSAIPLEGVNFGYNPTPLGCHDLLLAALKDKKFKELYSKLANRSEHWALLRTKLRNKIMVDFTTESRGNKECLDRAEWAKTREEAFTEIKIKNVDAVVVHVLSAVPEDDKVFIFDQITQQLPVVPSHFLSSPSEDGHTWIEVALFGKDIAGNEEVDEDGGYS